MIRAAPLLVALSLGAGDDPFVRSRVDTGVSNDPTAHCLWWGVPDITFVHDVEGNPETTGQTEFDAAEAAVGTWAAANDTCGSLHLSFGPPESLRLVEIDDKNVLLYRMRDCGVEVPQSDPCWEEQTCMNTYNCWMGAQGTIALTTTTYDTETGEIFDSDIEMNGAWFVFTTVDAPPCVHPVYNQGCIATDVQNTLTHEIGHALGLDHTNNSGSTMNPSAPGGETSKRVLDPGTRSFICEAYPAGGPARDCIVEPVGQSLGDAEGCAAAGTGGAALALLALAGLSRRRRGPG